MKKGILILLILLFLSPPACAVNYPQLQGFVTDNANMIDPAYAYDISQLAAKIEQETTVEIAVVTIESLEGESMEMYAVKLFEQAGIGKKDKDNGLLILVAKEEREYRFEVGYGLEGTENRIAVERMRYNENVRDYNTRLKKMPGSIIAGMYGFTPKVYFEAEKGSEVAPKVNFT